MAATPVEVHYFYHANIRKAVRLKSPHQVTILQFKRQPKGPPSQFAVHSLEDYLLFQKISKEWEEHRISAAEYKEYKNLITAAMAQEAEEEEG